MTSGHTRRRPSVCPGAGRRVMATGSSAFPEVRCPCCEFYARPVTRGDMTWMRSHRPLGGVAVVNAPPRFRRIAAGDYETADGTYRLIQLDGGATRAWNVEYTQEWIERQIAADPEHWTPYDLDLVVDGAATKRDALALFAEWWSAR